MIEKYTPINVYFDEQQGIPKFEVGQEYCQTFGAYTHNLISID